MRNFQYFMPLLALITSPVLANEPANSPETSQCEVVEGWQEVAALNPRYVIFGEWHGTEQSPAFVGNLACALSKQGKRVLVAIEHKSEDNPAFQAAWAKSGVEFEEQLLTTTWWKGREDGVASVAMFDMIAQLHALKEQGYAVSMATFNGAKDDAQEAKFAHLEAQGPHEAAQAENIHDAANAGHYDIVLTLVGSLHASKQTEDWDGEKFDPMAMHLERYGDKVISLNMRFASGSVWNCQPNEMAEVICASRPDKGYEDLNRSPFINLSQVDDAYDGYFWLGPVTASPPKVPADREGE